MGGSGYRRRRRRDAADAAKLAMDGVFVSFSLPLSGGLHGHLLKHSGSSTQEERAAAEAAAAKLQPPSLLPRGGYAHAAKKAAAAAAAAKFAAKKATAAAAAAKLATQKAVAEAAAAVKAQEEEAACPFYELALWHLEVGKGNGKVGSAVKHTTPVSQHLEFRQAAKVRHVVNSVLQTAYEQKKKALAARLGAANVNEQFLFHGTSMANSDGIIHSNFKLSKVRTSTGDKEFFGRGFYFADNLHYAHGYCSEDSHALLVGTDSQEWEIVVFEPSQVMPVYRVRFF